MSPPKQPYTPQLYHFLKRYQEDPTSRVFAPLAEAYRKAGLLEEAIEIATEGMKKHPTFVGGKVALSRALYDSKRYTEVVELLKPVAIDAPDNLVAQRLVADSCLILGRVAEALACYKMLLYFVPDDYETVKIVRELESQAYESGALVLRTDYEVRPTQHALSGDPESSRSRKIRKIEILQNCLQKVERYRLKVIMGFLPRT